MLRRTGLSLLVHNRKLSLTTGLASSRNFTTAGAEPGAPKWLNASPCGNVCQTCPQAVNCINVTRPASYLNPIPWVAWAVLGAFAAAGCWAIVYPKSLINWYVGEGGAMLPSEDHQRLYQGIARRMGMRYPEKILFLETTSYGPTCVGSDSARGGVVFLPKQLVEVSLSDAYSDEDRKRLLTEQGVLLPLPEELVFVIGHECGHLQKRHALHTAIVSLLAAGSASALLKSWNAMLWNHPRYGRLVVRSPPLFLLLVIGACAATSFVQSWLHELEADRESAIRLELQDVAVGLKEKQVAQNLAYRRLGDRAITPGGNDLSKAEHPPATLQLWNLQQTQRQKT